MSTSWWIPLGVTERIRAEVFDPYDQPLVDKTDIMIAIKRSGDGAWLDFDDLTFKTSGWVDRLTSMTQEDKTKESGVYYYDFVTSPYTTAATYFIRIEQSPRTDWLDILHGEMKVGGIPNSILNTETGVTELLARLTLSRAAALDKIPGMEEDNKLLLKIHINRLDMRSGSTNNWVLYDDDSTTELLEWDVSDVNGDAILLRPQAPARRTKGILNP